MDSEKVNILIVDDKPEKLLALEAVLEDLRQNIVRAYSGREALRALLTLDFAVILLDVNMPGMDGFETAAMIRQRKSTEHTPIIFVTAFGDENHSVRGYSLGAVDYIQTPVVPDVLKTKVAVFVDLYRKTEQVRRQADSLRRRAVQLQKLAAASMAINASVSIEKMLQTVSDSARDIIGAHQAICLCLADPYSGQRPAKPQAVTSFSDKYADWRRKKLDLTAITTTLVAQSRNPTRMTVAELHDHPDWEIVRQLEIPPIEGGMLAAPLAGRAGANLGIIYLCDRFEGDFTHDDEAVLVQLAQMAAIAIENTIFAEERETNRIKDEFLSVLSHELRTPLNAILGWTQLLRMTPAGDEDAVHGLDVIERNARAQAKLVEDLLDVSRVTTGKLRLNKRTTDFSAVVSAALDAIRPTAEAKEVAVQLSTPANDPALVVNGDPDRLQQVVWNLLSNAVKFTPAAGRVEVSLDTATGNIRLRVTDSGQGISPAFLPYVFDRFRQADSTSTRSHGGLGIGLTIVRHIVELHGGSVAADSAGEGKGATFIVTLPPAPRLAAENIAKSNGNGQHLSHEVSASRVTEAPPDDLASPRPTTSLASDDASDSPIDLSGIRVLVVDDDPDAREMMAVVIGRAGADVCVAGSVNDALSTISRHDSRPDVIVSDIAMPDRDGYDLIRTVRQLPEHQGGNLPAIALTAYAREEDRLRSIASGFQAHLNKPTSPRELLATIAHLAEPSHRKKSESVSAS
jgi:signal transduction histidine kinase/DNA-binding response OmpR family regulator